MRRGLQGVNQVADKQASLQDVFLNSLRRGKTPVTMFLVKGVKLQGIVTWFDNFSLLLRRDGQSQLVYKHAISTIQPGGPVDLGTPAAPVVAAGRPLQDQFLAAARVQAVPVTMFLVNGVMLQGLISGFDLFVLLLERDGQSQLVYKHAISTIQPSAPLSLGGDGAGDGPDDAEVPNA